MHAFAMRNPDGALTVYVGCTQQQAISRACLGETATADQLACWGWEVQPIRLVPAVPVQYQLGEGGPVTDEELETIKALYASATDGPWCWEDWNHDDGTRKFTLAARRVPDDDAQASLWKGKMDERCVPVWLTGCGECGWESEANEADREVLAGGRTLVPRLVRSLQDARQQTTEDIKRATEKLRRKLSQKEDVIEGLRKEVLDLKRHLYPQRYVDGGTK